MPTDETDELVFVVDVTSFTEMGFLGSTTYDGRRIDIEFDDADTGLTLSAQMCKRILVKSESKVTIIAEEEQKLEIIESIVASVGERIRISNAKLYYIIGRSGGGIFRVRKS